MLNFIKGVINFCGDIVFIVDLCIKFNVGEVIYNDFIIVIMFNVYEWIVGIVVDGVFDVICFFEEDMLLLLEFGVVFDSKYFYGLVDVDEYMVILVNIESLIISNELGLVEIKV